MIEGGNLSRAGGLLAYIDEALARQADLSAAQRFAERHDSAPPGDFQLRTYRDLVPLSRPGPGEQYAFEVDLDACSGCKACVAACNSLNGLAPGETWRQVGLLVGTRVDGAFLQHVTGACHHCVEPSCAEGCPAAAYEKDAETGIVFHLDDQCIGCRYCTLMCPYEVPKYHAELGIVRKCDLCHGRLATGEAPACVQSCPNQAIRIAVVDRAGMRTRSGAASFLPGAPEPELTRPTTVYRSARGLPEDAVPADVHEVRPGEEHPPLVAMLVLTQLSTGAFLVGRAVEATGAGVFASVRPVHAVTALAAGLLALAASTLHLGRPLQAWRALIGLRTSWLSREIAAFGLFAVLAAAYAGATRITPASPVLSALGAAVVAAGLAGIACSAMVYHVTHRKFWSIGATTVRFLASTILLGLSATLFAGLLATAVTPTLSIAEFLASSGRGLCAALAVTTAAKLVFEGAVFRHLRFARRSRRRTPLQETALLMAGELANLTAARFLLGGIGGVLVPLLFAAGAIRAADPLPLGVAISLVSAFSLAGEVYERRLFFRAATAPRMPGLPGASLA